MCNLQETLEPPTIATEVAYLFYDLDLGNEDCLMPTSSTCARENSTVNQDRDFHLSEEENSESATSDSLNLQDQQ